MTDLSPVIQDTVLFHKIKKVGELSKDIKMDNRGASRNKHWS